MSISKVALRRKLLSNGKKESLVLEFTPPILDKDTLCRVHKKHLGIYIWAKPKTEEERDYNDEMLSKAEAIRSHWVQSIINEDYGFLDKTKMKGDFLEYYRNIALAKRENSKWWGSYQHFEKFIHGHCTFEQMDVYIAKRFAEYLMTATSVRRPGVPMHTNTRASYFSTFRAVRMRDYEDSMKWLNDAAKLRLNPQIPRRVDETKKPVTDWQLATFQNDYDPYRNPWMV